MTQDAAVLEASGCQSHDVVVPDFVCFCFQEAWDKGFLYEIREDRGNFQGPGIPLCCWP